MNGIVKHLEETRKAIEAMAAGTGVGAETAGAKAEAGATNAAAEVVAGAAGVVVAGAAGSAIVKALWAGNKVLSFGNGGSATQASHLAGELIGRYKMNRRPFPAIALSSDPGSVTCIANDFGYESLFERQVEALAQPGDVVIGLTTSGSSKNVLRGLEAGKKKEAVTIALTGAAGLKGGDGGTADHIVAVPSDVTAHIQEIHLMIIHAWCIKIDEELGSK